MQSIVSIISSNEIYRNKINNLLDLPEVSNNLKIQFALYCAKQCNYLIDANKHPELKEKVSKCLDLVGSYLLGEKITAKNLYAAANAANAAAYAAANAAAEAAAEAAYAAANAANAAAYAAAYAAIAANAAANAAIAANAAANAATKEEKLKELYEYLLNMLIKEFNLSNTFRILYIS